MSKINVRFVQWYENYWFIQLNGEYVGVVGRPKSDNYWTATISGQGVPARARTREKATRVAIEQSMHFLPDREGDTAA